VTVTGLCAFCLAYVVLCVYVFICVCDGWVGVSSVHVLGKLCMRVLRCVMCLRAKTAISYPLQHDCGFIFSSIVCAVD